mmetsp:Transcript_48238/g.108649  ORF Transcript_48238/g.108649 Transcript_48238/m.108649 type:complete len:112 (-) Transcript_48238:562-897(-)
MDQSQPMTQSIQRRGGTFRREFNPKQRERFLKRRVEKAIKRKLEYTDRDSSKPQGGKAEAARKRRRDANGSFAKAEPSRAESHEYGFDSEQECPVHDHSNLHAMFDLGDPA